MHTYSCLCAKFQYLLTRGKNPSYLCKKAVRIVFVRLTIIKKTKQKKKKKKKKKKKYRDNRERWMLPFVLSIRHNWILFSYM